MAFVVWRLKYFCALVDGNQQYLPACSIVLLTNRFHAIAGYQKPKRNREMATGIHNIHRGDIKREKSPVRIDI